MATPTYLPTRDRIIDGALRLFARKGYAGVSLSELADEVGLTKAALYHHFVSKEAILEASVEAYFEAMDRLIERASSAYADPESILRSYLVYLVDHRETALVVTDRVLSDHPVGERARRQFERLARSLVGPEEDPGAAIRAVAALGAVGAVATLVPAPVVRALREEVVLAAARALGAGDDVDV